MVDVVSALTSGIGSLIGANSSTTGSAIVSQVVQNVAIGAAGSALLASLQHPDVLKALDPLGITNLLHPVTGGAVAGTTPTAAATTATANGINPVAKTITVSWYSANPTVAPLYVAQGWTIIPG
jgi:hypothetical protein